MFDFQKVRGERIVRACVCVCVCVCVVDQQLILPVRSAALSLSVSSVPIVLIYSAFNPDQQTVSAVEKSRHTPLHAFIWFSDKGVRDPESCDGSRRLKVLLFLPPLGRSASPPDGLPPFNAGVAARRTAAARGRRWEGTESRWIDLRTAVGAPWGEPQHMTRGVGWEIKATLWLWCPPTGWVLICLLGRCGLTHPVSPNTEQMQSVGARGSSIPPTVIIDRLIPIAYYQWGQNMWSTRTETLCVIERVHSWPWKRRNGPSARSL